MKKVKTKCFRCGRAAPEVKFSWTSSGMRREVCDDCFSTGQRRAEIVILETRQEGEFVVHKLPAAEADGCHWKEIRRVTNVWYGGMSL